MASDGTLTVASADSTVRVYVPTIPSDSATGEILSLTPTRSVRHGLHTAFSAHIVPSPHPGNNLGPIVCFGTVRGGVCAAYAFQEPYTPVHFPCPGAGAIVDIAYREGVEHVREGRGDGDSVTSSPLTTLLLVSEGKAAFTVELGTTSHSLSLSALSSVTLGHLSTTRPFRGCFCASGCVIGAEDGSVMLWDSTGGETRVVCPSTGLSVWGLCSLSQSNQVVVCGEAGVDKVRVGANGHELTTPIPTKQCADPSILTLNSHVQGVFSIPSDATGTYLLTHSDLYRVDSGSGSLSHHMCINMEGEREKAGRVKSWDTKGDMLCVGTIGGSVVYVHIPSLGMVSVPVCTGRPVLSVVCGFMGGRERERECDTVAQTAGKAPVLIPVPHIPQDTPADITMDTDHPIPTPFSYTSSAPTPSTSLSYVRVNPEGGWVLSPKRLSTKGLLLSGGCSLGVWDGSVPISILIYRGGIVGAFTAPTPEDDTPHLLSMVQPLAAKSPAIHSVCGVTIPLPRDTTNGTSDACRNCRHWLCLADTAHSQLVFLAYHSSDPTLPPSRSALPLSFSPMHVSYDCEACTLGVSGFRGGDFHHVDLPCVETSSLSPASPPFLPTPSASLSAKGHNPKSSLWTYRPSDLQGTGVFAQVSSDTLRTVYCPRVCVERVDRGIGLAELAGSVAVKGADGVERVAVVGERGATVSVIEVSTPRDAVCPPSLVFAASHLGPASMKSVAVYYPRESGTDVSADPVLFVGGANGYLSAFSLATSPTYLSPVCECHYTALVRERERQDAVQARVTALCVIPVQEGCLLLAGTSIRQIVVYAYHHALSRMVRMAVVPVDGVVRRVGVCGSVSEAGVTVCAGTTQGAYTMHLPPHFLRPFGYTMRQIGSGLTFRDMQPKGMASLEWADLFDLGGCDTTLSLTPFPQTEGCKRYGGVNDILHGELDGVGVFALATDSGTLLTCKGRVEGGVTVPSGPMSHTRISSTALRSVCVAPSSAGVDTPPSLLCSSWDEEVVQLELTPSPSYTESDVGVSVCIRQRVPVGVGFANSLVTLPVSPYPSVSASSAPQCQVCVAGRGLGVVTLAL
ncbi:hypothetical protein KIPB_000056 [Kipferlia bialata]|uniref:Uncharacterized protein n=1 Tax=Kipferlia bialata TaxID=797122 RepID=A0A9K3CLP4_9EUKA|nr:hypothetical protein KIPB_000056 [Kipferlia bialata]|eukprot:g56.t1